MTLRNLFVSMLAAAIVLPSLYAQDEPERGQRGERQRGGERADGPRGPGGPPGGGMMGMMGGMISGGASQLMGLLRNEDVRKEIGLEDSVFQAIQEAQRESIGKMRGLRDASDEERKKIMEEINASSQDLMDEVLTPAQQKRLTGLLAQIMGPSSALNDLIAKELKLSDATKAEMAKELEAFGVKMREMFASMREGGGFPDITKIQESWDELGKAIEAKLDDGQKKSFEAIKGEKSALADGGIMGLMSGAMGGGGLGGFGGRGAPGGDRGGDRPQRPRRNENRD